MFIISNLIHLFFAVIYLIILTVVILSWIPIFDIRKEPIASVVKIYNLIMAPFKAIIPPIGMIDISPLIAFFFFRFLEIAITRGLMMLGL